MLNFEQILWNRDAGRYRRGLLDLEVPAPDGDASDLRRQASLLRTEGVARLVPTMDKIPFPELWSARGFIGDPPAACPHMH
jgi:hypothetical protein